MGQQGCDFVLVPEHTSVHAAEEKVTLNTRGEGRLGARLGPWGDAQEAGDH